MAFGPFVLLEDEEAARWQVFGQFFDLTKTGVLAITNSRATYTAGLTDQPVRMGWWEGDVYVVRGAANVARTGDGTTAAVPMSDAVAIGYCVGVGTLLFLNALDEVVTSTSTTKSVAVA